VIDFVLHQSIFYTNIGFHIKTKNPEEQTSGRNKTTTIPENPGAVTRKPSSIQTVTVGSGISPDQSLTLTARK